MKSRVLPRARELPDSSRKKHDFMIRISISKRRNYRDGALGRGFVLAMATRRVEMA